MFFKFWKIFNFEITYKNTEQGKNYEIIVPKILEGCVLVLTTYVQRDFKEYLKCIVYR